MDVKSLIPWNRSKTAPALRYDEEGGPFLALHREVNRLFDDFFHGFDMPMTRAVSSNFWPQVDVADSAKAVTVTAELPGLDEKEVELTLQDGVLTLRGEKKSASDGPQYSELWHGMFGRILLSGAGCPAGGWG